MAMDYSTELKKKKEEVEKANTALQTAQSNYSDYVKAGYTPGESVKAAKANYEDYLGRLTGYAPYSNPNSAAMQAALDAVVDRKPFKFSTDGDALYERYKNGYQAAGRQAMQDAVGAASALTGGYGNSYAATAGAQAYNDYLSRMDDVIPELYQLALDKYNAEGSELAQRYSVLAADDERGYGRWQNGYNMARDLANLARSDYDAERSFDYGLWGDRGAGLSALYGMAGDAYANAAAAEDAQYGREYQEQRDAMDDYLSIIKATSGGSGGGSGSVTVKPYFASYDKLPEEYKEDIAYFVDRQSAEGLKNHLQKLIDKNIIDDDTAYEIWTRFKADNFRLTDNSHRRISGIPD